MESQFTPPSTIFIDNYEYKFKKILAKNKLSYRCKWRTLCKIIITIDQAELIKVSNFRKNIQLIYKISSDKGHTCNKRGEICISNNNMSSSQNNQTAVQLIKLNLSKPLSWHFTNLRNQNIFVSKNKIKNLLKAYREEKYPNDIEFIQNTENININYGTDDNPIMNPFCLTTRKFINNKKKIKKRSIFCFLLYFISNYFRKQKKFIWMLHSNHTQTVTTNYLIFSFSMKRQTIIFRVFTF